MRRLTQRRTIVNAVLTAVALAAVLAVPATSAAQWPKFEPKGLPKTKDGKVDLTAPTPRTADGKPDLSGMWETAPPPRAAARPVAAAGTGEAPPPGSGSIFFNAGAQTPGGAPYRPWAAELVKKRLADGSKDNPDAHCLPMGIMQMTSHPYPRKIIQAKDVMAVIYEGSGTTVREIFLDGRPLPNPKDVEPWWNGYSVGHWEGDTLVVETVGLIDDGWLDVQGSPLTSEGKLTERYRRTNFGTLEIAVTIDDPKAYTKPFTATVLNRLSPDTQLIEFVCIDKSAQHYVGADGVASTPKK